MTFTDDDLKLLKEDFEVPTMPKGCWQSHKKMRSLLARLQAAEACCRTARNYQLKREENSLDWKEHLAYFGVCWEGWRKEAGK